MSAFEGATVREIINTRRISHKLKSCKLLKVVVILKVLHLSVGSSLPTSDEEPNTDIILLNDTPYTIQTVRNQ